MLLVFFFFKKFEETSMIAMKKFPKKNPESSCNHSWRNRSYQQMANKYHSAKLNLNWIESNPFDTSCAAYWIAVLIYCENLRQFDTLVDSLWNLHEVNSFTDGNCIICAYLECRCEFHTRCKKQSNRKFV